MRVAFVGKGGAGKSLIAGTAARLLARAGRPVLVVDSDPLPGLAFAVGMPAVDTGIPDEAVHETQEDGRRRYRLRPGLSAAEAVRRYAATGPDGVRVLQFGKVRGHVRELARSQAAFHAIVDGLGDGDWEVIGDLPGGTRQPFFGWGRYASTVVVVAEPGAASLASARRLARLARMPQAPRVVAVANKVRRPDDAALVAQRSGLEVVGVVPADPAVAAAERRGGAPVDLAPQCPAVEAIASLLQRLSDDGKAPS